MRPAVINILDVEIGVNLGNRPIKELFDRRVGKGHPVAEMAIPENHRHEGVFCGVEFNDIPRFHQDVSIALYGLMVVEH